MKFLTTLFLALFGFQFTLSAQADAAAAKPEDELGWKYTGSFGLDLGGSGIVNPRLGAGANRIGFGGIATFAANNKQAKTFWDNSLGLQLGVQRIGGKKKDDGTDNPFQKNLDIIRLASRYGYKIAGDKLYLAIDATAETQVLKTYVGNVLKGETDEVVSAPFAPLSVAVAPGLDYKPTANLSFFFAPASWKFIYVGLEDLRGSLADGAPLGNVPGKASRSQLGLTLKAQYVNKYFNDRAAFASKFGWFSGYYNQTAEGEDKANFCGSVLWQNTLDIEIFKGLALGLVGDIAYDHFINVQVDGDPTDLRQRPTYVGSFLLKYNKIF